MKKLVALFIVFSLFLYIPFNVGYADNVKIAEQLNKLGILTGDGNGNLNLDDNLKRQDMVVIISRLHKEENTAKSYPVVNKFDDFTQDNSFYHSYISWAVNKKLIEGVGNNKFGFDDAVTVIQFQTVLLRALGYTEEAKLSDSIPDIAKKIGLMEGVSGLSYKDNLTRGDMAVMIYNALNIRAKGSPLKLSEILKVDL
ncbi:S-layer homology domain-containing protein [Soehngenia saccharolytica]|nr:S-layer homology domain-containing protein [Soehngenia saccharolytica]